MATTLVPSDLDWDIFDVQSWSHIHALAWGLADAHLEVLSMPWVVQPGFFADQDDDYYCPVCDRRENRNRDDCAWLVSARACGVL